MRKFTLSFVVVMMTVLGLFSVKAQAEDWQVYLHNGIDNTLIRVSANGESDVVDFGFGDNTFVGAGDFAFSSDGTLAAVCANQPPTSENMVQMWQFILRDLVSGTNLIDMQLDDIAGCRMGAFSPDDSTIAVGILNYIAFDETADTSGPEWEIRLYDLNGGIANSITANEAPPAVLSNLANFPIIPTVTQFDDNGLVAIGYPGVGMGIGGALPVFGWSFADNSITEVPTYFGNLNGDFLPATGETVFAELDDSLPAGEPMGPVFVANTVRVADANGDITTIYENTVDVILNATFINDGQAVLVQLLEPFNMDEPTEISTSRFVIIGRDGVVSEIDQHFLSFAQGVAVPGGWILVWAEQDPTQAEPPINHIDDYTSGTATRVYTYETPENSERWTILGVAWTPEIMVNGDLPAFTAFVR